MKKHIRLMAVSALIAAALLAHMLGDSGRLYWPYMASAYIVGVFVWLLEFENAPEAEKPPLLRYLFPREVWLHESSLRDCGVALINLAIIAVVFDKVTLISPDAWQRRMESLAELLPARHAAAPGIGAIALYVLAGLLLSELFYYASHRMTHRIPALWEFHKVHHSAKVMTPLTLYRMHPFDIWLNETFRAAGLGLATAVFLYLYPGTRSVAVAAAFTASTYGSLLVAANLRHSHIWLSFGPKVERFFFSPAQHQIHHSEDPRHYDKNYGSLFAVWDWLFGSLYVPQGREKITFGLGSRNEEAPYETVLGMYVHPVKKLFRRK